MSDPLPAGLEAVQPNVSHDLEAGVYALSHLLRAVTPGTFFWPGATVQLRRAPEEFGRTAVTQLIVKFRTGKPGKPRAVG